MTTTFDVSPRQASKGPKVLLIIGGIALTVGVVMAVIGAVLFGSGLVDTVENMAQARENLDTEVAVPGSTEVYLQPETYDVVAIGNGLVRQRDPDAADDRSNLEATDFNEPTVTVTSAEGQPLTLRSPRGKALVRFSDYEMVSISSFEVVTAGTYRIDATGEPGPVTTVGVGQASQLDGEAISRALGGGLLFGLGVLLLVPGILLLVGGTIWFFVDRANRRSPPPGSPPPGWPPAGGSLPPPWPPPGRPPGPYSPSGQGGVAPFDAPSGPSTRPPAPPWEPPQSPIS